MRRLITVTSLSVCLAACGDSRPAVTEPQEDVEIREVSQAALAAAGLNEGHLRTLSRQLWLPALRGAEEVPPRETRARGAALLLAQNNETTLGFVLTVKRIRNVVQAHIHIGPKGANGPVTAFLYGPVAPNGGPEQGVLAIGEVTNASLIGPLAGKTIADLLVEIRAGNAYVNVHTDDGVAPPNTGPGDFPGGEVRGQITPHKH
jgi:hypothetical protein